MIMGRSNIRLVRVSSQKYHRLRCNWALKCTWSKRLVFVPTYMIDRVVSLSSQSSVMLHSLLRRSELFGRRVQLRGKCRGDTFQSDANKLSLRDMFVWFVGAQRIWFAGSWGLLSRNGIFSRKQRDRERFALQRVVRMPHLIS